MTLGISDPVFRKGDIFCLGLRGRTGFTVDEKARGDFRAGVQGAFPFVARSILFLITHGLASVFSGSWLAVIFLSRGFARYAFAGLDTRRYEDLV
jgi:hypothetical protein